MLSMAQPAGSNALAIKAHNLSALLLTLLRHQPISRVRLARQIGLSSTTVTNLVAELLDQGVVQEDGTDTLAMSAGAGRLPRALRLVPTSRYALGIFIGVRWIRLALSDLGARIIDSTIIAHQPGEDPASTAGRMAEAARTLLRHNEALVADRVLGLGVGASGLVASDTGVNIFAPGLGWRDVPLRDLLGAALGLPVVVDNNVRTMALAERMFGAGLSSRALIFVYAQVGVGAGIVVDGQIYRGADHGAGEIGHWTIVPDGGVPCACGNTGCLETLIAEAAIVRMARAMRPDLSEQSELALPAVFLHARAGDRALQSLLAERGRYVGIALANLVNVLNPELILLGGLLHAGYDLLQPAVEQTMRQRAFAGLGQRVRLLPASFGHHSGEIGALALALHSLFFQPQTAGERAERGA